jgi:hypothetical protein
MQRSGFVVTGGRAAEDIGEFGEAGEDVDRAQSRHGAAHEVVGEQLPQSRDGLGEVIPVPERGPRNQNEQEACFEQQGD